ncbi:MAG: hypothetical protein Q4F95_00890 [Oscillospiraceae bacterium]|nr:hypothetical protein [Oscillospiraceae bacterium]
MSTAGEGTEANPWVIHDVTELREKAIVSGAFLKLANNIACGSSPWTTIAGISNNKSTIDFDGSKLIEPYIQENNRLFENVNVKQGKISDITEDSFNILDNGCAGLFLNCGINDMAISASLDTFQGSGQMFTGCSIDNIRAEIEFVNKKNYGGGVTVFSNTNISDSYVKLYGNTINNRFFYGSQTITVSGTSFEGKAAYFGTFTDYSVNIYNNVFNFESSLTAHNFLTIYSWYNRHMGNNIYNSDIASYNQLDGLKPVTETQINSPDSLLSDAINFPVNKVVLL